MFKILPALLLVCSQQVCAQMHISTNLRQDYSWSDSENKWVLTSSDENSSTLFDFNKELTMFKHTTESISSTYYIKTEIQKNSDQSWEFDAVSDVGNKYHVVIDVANNNIRFVGKDDNGNTYCVRHTIKRIWFDE